MPRGGHNVKLAGKKSQPEDSTPSLRVFGLAAMATKAARTSTDKRSSISAPSFLSRNSSGKSLAGSLSDQPALCNAPIPSDATTNTTMDVIDNSLKAASINTVSACEEDTRVQPPPHLDEPLSASRPISCGSLSTPTISEENTCEDSLSALEHITVQETQSSASSMYSRESMSIFSTDSASIYSSASSISSSGASTYSFEACVPERSNSDLGNLQYQPRTGTIGVRPPLKRRDAAQDAISRERSTLAKKAALFKNSRLPPSLPAFRNSIPTWAMVCRAAQASSDCYVAKSVPRRGTYTLADPSRDLKAMIIDDQKIDDSRLIVVAIRGTNVRSMADWAANKDADPTLPEGFLDDKENACHSGFLRVAKAMVGQIAEQLRKLNLSSERASLVFTGHSAGGAVAALLYSHMVSLSVESELATLESEFCSINCVTFGAPPISERPLPRRDHRPSVFLGFVNEGDPVARLSNAAYMKSLAKLMTASPPSAVAPVAAPVKVVRRSRGTAVVREIHPVAPPTPWEELPLWPTPPAPLTIAGDVVLLRDNQDGKATASKILAEDLSDAIFSDLAEHGTASYIRRIKELTLSAMLGVDLD